MSRGSFKIRIKNFDPIGEKQFSLNVDNKKVGKTFKA
jgi:hypothetical protein